MSVVVRAIFVVLALFIPYLALVAPFRCGGYPSAEGMPPHRQRLADGM
jgi:hypothetical protein